MSTRALLTLLLVARTPLVPATTGTTVRPTLAALWRPRAALTTPGARRGPARFASTAVRRGPDPYRSTVI